MNRAELRAVLEPVKKAIMASPNRYDQETFCDSECCIAGWIDILKNGEAKHLSRGRNWRLIHIEACNAVEDRDPWIFESPAEYWPCDLAQAYIDAAIAGDSKTMAQVACRAIDHYIEERPE